MGREGFPEPVARCGRRCTLDEGKGSVAALRFPLPSEAGGLGLDQREEGGRRRRGLAGCSQGRFPVRGQDGHVYLEMRLLAAGRPEGGQRAVSRQETG